MLFKNYYLFIILIIIWRILLFPLSSYFEFGGGNDSDYYHQYALGQIDIITNIWPIILRWLNDIGLYDRYGLSFLLWLSSLILIPFLFSKIISGYGTDKRYKKYAILITLMYPSIIFFTSDIYRDVGMYLLFLFAIIFLKKFYLRKNFISFGFLILFFIISIILFGLRPYLGVATGLALAAVYFLKIFRYRLKMLLLVYFFGLVTLKYLNILDPILQYRGESGFDSGGSSLGIGLINSDLISFNYLFIYSFIAQVLGIFYSGLSSVFVLLTESLIFIYALFYVFKNIKYADKICLYLISFFIIYTTIWVLGNDNLGTAVRLRVPSYLSIIACWLIIVQRKNNSISNLLVKVNV